MQAQTFNIALPKELVINIDKQAKKNYQNRSELIREAVRIYLQEQTAWEEIFKLGKKTTKRLNLRSEKDVDKIIGSRYKNKTKL